MKGTINHRLFVSSLLNPSGENGEYLREIYDSLKHYTKLHIIKNTSDIWMRDYMPIQINEKTFVTYKYRPDYLCCKERKHWMTKRFSSLAEIEKNRKEYWNDNESQLPFYTPGVSIRECQLILDGGNIVVFGDKIILTDKVFIENRPKTPDYVIGELKRAFGKEVVIIPSDPYEIKAARDRDELPLCHADGILAPIDEETILIAYYGRDPLGYVPQLMNVLTRYIKPENIKHFDFSEVIPGHDVPEEVWVYINFLRVGDIVFVPVLGGEFKVYDEAAVNQLKKFLKTDNVVPINTRILSLGKDENGKDVNSNCGGALHCITWDVVREVR